MYKQLVIERVLRNLSKISMEKMNSLRRSELNKYFNSTLEEDERELLLIILSFQVISPFKQHRIVFNTLPSVDVEQELRVWFTKYDVSITPYVIQKLVFFMSSSKALGLKPVDIAGIVDDYIDPYQWLQEHNIDITYTDFENKCNLCGVEETTNDLCDNCIEHLKSFTDFRVYDFDLEVSNATCKWLIADNLEDKPFMFNYGRYNIERVGTTKIEFRNIEHVNERFQGNLPIKEYQIEINV